MVRRAEELGRVEEVIRREQEQIPQTREQVSSMQCGGVAGCYVTISCYRRWSW